MSPEINGAGRINAAWGPLGKQRPVWLTAEQVRSHASVLLAAADEAETRAARPGLPTAVRSVIRTSDGGVYTRLGLDSWMRVGSVEHYSDREVAGRIFTVLDDPDEPEKRMSR